jgi:homoserine kinase type II
VVGVSVAVAADAERISAELAKVAASRDSALPTGITHGDLFRDNVLWDGLELTALLDFESACRGVFIYDLMVCVLAWCYRDGFELGLVRALVAGYDSVRPLSAEERAAAITEGTVACLRFATTRITDFEMRAPAGVAPLRDYRRFLKRSQDLRAGALDSVFGA